MYLFIWLSEWGGDPTFATGPGSVSHLSGPAHYEGSVIESDFYRDVISKDTFATRGYLWVLTYI